MLMIPSDTLTISYAVHKIMHPQHSVPKTSDLCYTFAMPIRCVRNASMSNIHNSPESPYASLLKVKVLTLHLELLSISKKKAHSPQSRQ